MDLQTIAETLKIPGDFQGRVHSFIFDSRKASTNSLFFALPGQKVQGSAFLKDAANRGAMAAIVEEDYRGSDYGLALLRVPNVLSALHHLAREKMKNSSARVIGITGSMGKTTTKECVAGILSAKYRVFKTPDNYNTQISFPVSILNSPDLVDFFVLEMGMSAKGHIEQLASIAMPHISLVTYIGHSHIEFFSGLEEISAVKAEIYSSPRLEWQLMSHQASQYRAISQKRASICVYNLEATYQISGTKIQFTFRGETSPWISISFQESHLLENLLAAVAIAKICDMSWEEISQGFSKIQQPQHRFQQVSWREVLFINDSYNANIESTIAALQNLPRPRDKGRRLLVFGEMKELGKFSDEAHGKVASAAVNIIDSCFCLGSKTSILVEEFARANKKAWYFQERESLQQALYAQLQPGDVVLVKGANSHRLWEIVPSKK